MLRLLYRAGSTAMLTLITALGVLWTVAVLFFLVMLVLSAVGALPR